mgnify:CR=1 FL=1
MRNQALLALSVVAIAISDAQVVPVPLQPAAQLLPSQNEANGTPANPAASTPAATTNPATPPGSPKAPTTPPDPDTALLAKFAKAKFDRRPSAILEDWAGAGEEAEPEAGKTETAPGAKPAPSKDENDIAIASLGQDVTRGDWSAVAEFFADRFQDEEKAAKAYGMLLDALARPPKRSAPSAPRPPSGAPPQPRPSSSSAYAERNLLLPADVLGLADACPGALDRDSHVPKLANLLKIALARGQFPDGLLAALTTGTAKLGGADDAVKRDLAARLLIAAGLPEEAGDFLPGPGEAETPEALDLLASYHLAMQAREPKKEHLAAAWQVTQALLSHPELGREAKEKALAQAVALAPKVEEELGARWLGESFTGDAARGREVLATIGAMTSRGRGEPSPDGRLRRLNLQKTAVDALLTASDLDLEPWREVLTLLALNWLDEGEHTRRLDSSQTLRPQVRWDPFGNMYYEQRPPTSRSSSGSSNTPRPISTGEVLKTRPDDSWLDQIEADLRPKFASLYAQLLLKVNEPEEAFPFIERVATEHPETGQDLAEEVLRLWAD